MLCCIYLIDKLHLLLRVFLESDKVCFPLVVKIENNLISNARVLLTLSWAGFRQILNTLIYSHGLLYNVAWYKHLFWFKVQYKWINSNKRLPLACVASVSVCFRRPRNGRDSRFWPREKWTAVLLTPIFCAVFDSRSLFFAPKPHGNTCYAG